MSSHTEFQLQMMLQTLDIDRPPLLQIIHTTKSLNRDIIKICLLVSDEGMFYFPHPIMFQIEI